MPSITAWTRLEPRVRRTDPAVGLEARVHDPLWLLARQWQVGEFAAEDAGSPLQVHARIERSRLTRYLPGTPDVGGVKGRPYDPGELPLQVLVEREDGPMDLRRAYDSGLHFLRLLDHHGVGHHGRAYVARYPLTAPSEGAPLDPETSRLLRIAIDRVPDGARLASDLRATPGALPRSPPIHAGDQEQVGAAAEAWLEWLDSRVRVPSEGEASPWITERMEYAFAVAAPSSDGERVLIASECAYGHLDWHSFDQLPGATLGAAEDEDGHETLIRTAIPGPVTYRGMPAARWWEFEDGQVNFGSVDAGPTDLLRLLLLDFALEYGNDWFLMPVELPAGALYRITSLVVIDSFGERTLIRPYQHQAQTPGQPWRMFSLSTPRGSGNGDDHRLFLPPSVPPGLRGEPIEEVLLLRDEVANLAWAVERRVEEAGGRPFDRFEQYQRSRADSEPFAPTAGSRDLRYRLATSVPDYWLPLIPTRVDPDRADIRLARGRVLMDGSSEPIAPSPLGRLLVPGRPLHLFEEEVPRAGTRVTRSYQYVRWTDGSGHLWIARRKAVGRGEGASGLRFDALVPAVPGETA